MPKFIAVHPLDQPVSKENVVPVAKKCKSMLSTDAYWVKSWLELNDEGEVTVLYCEWDGKDVDTVKEALTNSIPELPFTKVCEMSEIHGEDFR